MIGAGERARAAPDGHNVMIHASLHAIAPQLGNAAATHLAGELFKLTTGTRMEHIPYRGCAPAVQDVVAGNVPVIFDSLPSSAAALRVAKVRAG